MNLEPSETQLLLQESVRGFLEKEALFDRIRDLEREGAYDAALWRALCAQGWPALPFAEEDGGAGGGLVDAGLLVEECARRAVLVPLLETVVAGRALAQGGGRALAQGEGGDLLAAMLAGDAVVVPAVLEARDRFDAIDLACAGGRLRGEKLFVDYGQHATHHLVVAREAGELALFAVASADPGVRCEPLRSIGRAPLCAVRYDGAQATRVAGARACAELVRQGRALASLQCVGSMQQALDMTVRYAGVREQFGRPIGRFQAVRHHCANMAMRVASARLLGYEALSALDAGSASDVQVALAKASASRAVPEVTMLAHQIHGGNGVIEENDLYFFTLRGKQHSLAWGTAEECLAVVAAEVDAPSDWL